ncbi:MAG: CCA tRNA nucleotidyltransferase [Acidobacteriota bacterium]|nr:CCA tRNA nucleotidyltransferase [Acidobacteriota bacterium]
MSDYLYTLESHLDAQQTRVVGAVQRIATEAGMNAWLAGGAMRELLRGAPVRDLDFVVERDALKIAKALALALGGKVASEDEWRRGAELELPGGVAASVSNSRTEKYARPGGKPQIAPATIHEDLARRDFTINAIALALNRGSRGLLIDPTNGQADLVNRELRTTSGSAFFDDPNRLFRLIRFRYVLGFDMVPRTQSQFENALEENYQKVASPTALAHEIRAAAGDVSVVGMLEAFDSHRLLNLLSPGLTGAKLNAPGLTKLEKMLHATLPPGTPGGSLALLSVLTELLNTHERAAVVRAFALPNAEAAEFRKLDAAAKKLESALKSARIRRPSDVWNVLHSAPPDEVLMVLYRSAVRVVHDRIRAYYEKYLPTAQEVTEEQVIAAGVKPGTPKFEKTFQTMIAVRLNARPRKPAAPEPSAAPMVAAAARGRK